MEERKKVKLNLRLFSDNIITTAWTKKSTASGIVLNAGKGEILTRQMVLAAGPAASVKIGEEVELNVARFPKKPHTPKTHSGYEHGIGEDRLETVVPIEYIDKNPYIFVSTREIKYVYEKSI